MASKVLVELEVGTLNSLSYRPSFHDQHFVPNAPINMYIRGVFSHFNVYFWHRLQDVHLSFPSYSGWHCSNLQFVLSHLGLAFVLIPDEELLSETAVGCIASYFVKIIWCSGWFCNTPPYFLGCVLLYLRLPKGGCCSISDDLTC